MKITKILTIIFTIITLFTSCSPKEKKINEFELQPIIQKILNRKLYSLYKINVKGHIFIDVKWSGEFEQNSGIALYKGTYYLVIRSSAIKDKVLLTSCLGNNNIISNMPTSILNNKEKIINCDFLLNVNDVKTDKNIIILETIHANNSKSTLSISYKNSY